MVNNFRVKRRLKMNFVTKKLTRKCFFATKKTGYPVFLY